MTDSHEMKELVQRGKAAARVGRLDEARPSIDTALKDLSSLGRSREAMKENLEQMRLVYQEIMRAREGQAETEEWLSSTEESLGKLQEQVRDLNSMRPRLELLQQETERITGSIADIESRREFVDEVHKRLG